MDDNIVSVLENILFYCEKIESFKTMFGNDLDDFLSNDAYNMSCAFSLMQTVNVSRRSPNGYVPRMTM